MLDILMVIGLVLLVIGLPFLILFLYFLMVGYIVNEMKEFGGIVIVLAFLTPPAIPILFLMVFLQKRINK